MKNTIKKYFLLDCLYINNIKANKDDFKRLLQEINNGAKYTTFTSSKKMNIEID